jgi:hypothetical protein
VKIQAAGNVELMVTWWWWLLVYVKEKVKKKKTWERESLLGK